MALQDQHRPNIFDTEHLREYIPRRKEIIQLAKRDIFPTDSKMAVFFTKPGQDGRKLLKVYKDTPDEIGVDFSDPDVRQGVIENEVAMGNALSEKYDGAIVQVQIDQSEPISAIEMRRLDPEQNLMTMMSQGRILGREVWENLVADMINAHFNPIVARSVDVGRFSFFLEELFQDEKKLILQYYPSKDEGFFQGIFDKSREFINAHSEQIDQFCAITGEPVFTHGDNKFDNKFLLPDNSVVTLDAVPRPDWAINTRKGDMMFGSVHATLLGYPDVRVFMNKMYNELYFARLKQEGVSEGDLDIVGNSLPVMDKIMDFYRFGIFLRLANTHKMSDAEIEKRMHNWFGSSWVFEQ
jgi:hypothetical protein